MATLSQIEEEDNEIYAYVVLGAICIGFLLLLVQIVLCQLRFGATPSYRHSVSG